MSPNKRYDLRAAIEANPNEQVTREDALNLLDQVERLENHLDNARFNRDEAMNPSDLFQQLHQDAVRELKNLRVEANRIIRIQAGFITKLNEKVLEQGRVIRGFKVILQSLMGLPISY